MAKVIGVNKKALFVNVITSEIEKTVLLANLYRVKSKTQISACFYQFYFTSLSDMEQFACSIG